MKNGLLIWNVLLTLAAGYLLVSHFSSKKNNGPGGGKSTGSDTSARANGDFRIAYFEMDSIAANFDMVKEVNTELRKKEQEINQEVESLTKNIQQRYNFFSQKAAAGTLSQAEQESASQEMKNLDDQLKNRKQQLDQEYSEFMVRRQNDIKTKIEGFMKDYNKTRNYSYIVSYEQGLFYYRDTVYNITADVVKGLNDLYKPVKK